MANVVAAIAGVLVLGALVCVWRAWAVFRTCLPAAAQVSDSSYTQALQDQDAPWGYGWYNRGKPGVRLIRDQVRFHDGDGGERRVWVSRWVSRRFPPSSTYVVWYNRRDADRATANGPAYWLGFAAILAAVLIGLIVAVAQIERARVRHARGAPVAFESVR